MSGIVLVSLSETRCAPCTTPSGCLRGVNTVQDLEEHFKNYMTSPFKALKDLDWTFAYGPEVGATSRFGHLIDHIALSTPVEVLKAEVQHLTNQLFSSAKPDTDLVLTDHNAIRVTFAV